MVATAGGTLPFVIAGRMQSVEPEAGGVLTRKLIGPHPDEVALMPREVGTTDRAELGCNTSLPTSASNGFTVPFASAATKSRRSASETAAMSDPLKKKLHKKAKKAQRLAVEKALEDWHARENQRAEKKSSKKA